MFRCLTTSHITADISRSGGTSRAREDRGTLNSVQGNNSFFFKFSHKTTVQHGQKFPYNDERLVSWEFPQLNSWSYYCLRFLENIFTVKRQISRLEAINHDFKGTASPRVLLWLCLFNFPRSNLKISCFILNTNFAFTFMYLTGFVCTLMTRCWHIPWFHSDNTQCTTWRRLVSRCWFDRLSVC